MNRRELVSLAATVPGLSALNGLSAGRRPPAAAPHPSTTATSIQGSQEPIWH